MSNERDVLLASSYARTKALQPMFCIVACEAFARQGFEVTCRSVKEGLVITPPEEFGSQAKFNDFITFLAYYAKQMLQVQEVDLYEGNE